MKLELPIEQIEIILNALGNCPYIQVATLIAEIQKQAQQQLSAPKVEDAG